MVQLQTINFILVLFCTNKIAVALPLHLIYFCSDAEIILVNDANRNSHLRLLTAVDYLLSFHLH